VGRRDIILLASTLAVVLVLVTLTLLAPVYFVPGQGYERHWVWDAPVIPVRHGYDDLSPEDIERLNRDPRQREILENMKNLPRSIPCTPIYIGPRTGEGRNPLGYLTMLSVIAWSMLFGHRWSNR
jgi:hypothetical protein